MKLSRSDPYTQDEWFGAIYRCIKCLAVKIWVDFSYCPLCGEKIEWEE